MCKHHQRIPLSAKICNYTAFSQRTNFKTHRLYCIYKIFLYIVMITCRAVDPDHFLSLFHDVFVIFMILMCHNKIPPLFLQYKYYNKWEEH